MGTEWLEEHFLPLIKLSKSTKDNLRTVVEHIAIQIADVLEKNKVKSVFVTGGGAYNQFLLDRIKHHYSVKIVLPSKQIIEYKEAIIFALMGALHLENKPTTIPSVTGARRAVVGGVKHKP